MHWISRKWARYQLSLKGRIMITKTFLLPQFTYIASVQEPWDKTCKIINRFTRNFVNTGTTRPSTGKIGFIKISCMDPKWRRPKFHRCWIFLFIVENFMGKEVCIRQSRWPFGLTSLMKEHQEPSTQVGDIIFQPMDSMETKGYKQERTSRPSWLWALQDRL